MGNHQGGVLIIKRFKKTKKNNLFLGNVLTILTGTTFAQALPVIASPILTRIYSPDEFGEFGLFIAILGVLSVIVCMRYELAIALPLEHRNAINLFVLSICISIVFSTIIFVVSLIINMTSIYHEIPPELAKVIWILPFAVLLTGIFQALLNWNIRMNRFKVIAKTQFYRSSSIVTSQIGTGFIINSSFTLMLSQLLGQMISVLYMINNSMVDIKKYKKHINKISIKKQMIKYRKFPAYNSWASLLNTASVQLPLFILAFFFNPITVGLYALANRVMAVPISIMGTAIAQPYLQKATEEYRENRLGEFSLRIYKVLLSLGLVPIILFSIIAPELFEIIFGAEWVKAGQYVQLLSVWLLFVFISSPLSHIFTIMELQKENLRFNLLLFLSRIIVLIIGGSTGNDIFTIFLFGITGAFIWFFQLVWLLGQTGVKVKEVLRCLIIEFVYGLPFIIILFVSKVFIEMNLLVIIIAIVIIFVFGVARFRVIKMFSGEVRRGLE